jgi:copper chaperone CopZ
MDHKGLLVEEFLMIKKTFKIPDMTCTNCAMKLESLEDTLEGVKEINASYHKLQMTVEYDESRLTDEQIIAAVKKKGYQALPL